MHYYVLLIQLLLASYWHSPVLPEEEGILRLAVSNVKTAEGWIWVGVYDSEENFLIKEKAIIKGVEVSDVGTVQMSVDEVKYGNCAVAVFHDINGNGEMDRNWIGIPTEPYAFSRKPRSKWRLPRFEEVVFDFEPQHTGLAVKLSKW